MFILSLNFRLILWFRWYLSCQKRLDLNPILNIKILLKQHCCSFQVNVDKLNFIYYMFDNFIYFKQIFLLFTRCDLKLEEVILRSEHFYYRNLTKKIIFREQFKKNFQIKDLLNNSNYIVNITFFYPLFLISIRIFC
jgi:hypothetical protein